MALEVFFCLLCIVVSTSATCLSGTYASGVTNPLCYVCPRNSLCVGCAPNSFPRAGSTGCVCNAGFDSPNGPNVANIGPCVSLCKPGTYSSRLKFEVEVVRADYQPTTIGVYQDAGQPDLYFKPPDASTSTMYIRRGFTNNFLASTRLTGNGSRIHSLALPVPVANIAGVTSMQEWCADMSIWVHKKVVIVARLVGTVARFCFLDSVTVNTVVHTEFKACQKQWLGCT